MYTPFVTVPELPVMLIEIGEDVETEASVFTPVAYNKPEPAEIADEVPNPPKESWANEELTVYRIGQIAVREVVPKDDDPPPEAESVPPEKVRFEPTFTVFKCKVPSPYKIPEGEVVPVPPCWVVIWANAVIGKSKAKIISSFLNTINLSSSSHW